MYLFISKNFSYLSPLINRKHCIQKQNKKFHFQITEKILLKTRAFRLYPCNHATKYNIQQGLILNNFMGNPFQFWHVSVRSTEITN